MPTLAERKSTITASLQQAREQSTFWAQRAVGLEAQLTLLTEIEQEAAGGLTAAPPDTNGATPPSPPS